MKMQCSVLKVICIFACVVNIEGTNCTIRFEDNNACACSEDMFDEVTCDPDENSVEIQPCFCMAFDNVYNCTRVGHCFYSCLEREYTKVKITSSVEFNANICNEFGPLHREGTFCGKCNESYGLAAYSYLLLSCVPCQNYGIKSWFKYFAVALLPLTVFYVVAVLLSINVTSSRYNGIVLVIQCITSHLQMVLIQENSYLNRFHVPIKVASSILGILNLDFFRMVYSPFCLNPKINLPEMLSLDYIVALYPFLLIFLTYLLVTLYDKKYKLLVFVWKPINFCGMKYWRAWNIRTSLTQVFATFVVLSYVKLLSTSFELFFIVLTSTNTYFIDAEGHSFYSYDVTYDATVPFFGQRHLPYAMMALCFTFVSTLPLVLVAVYPCRCFQRCLNLCGGRCQPLHVFMDVFLGHYRTRPRDLRYFSAFYLVLRILLIAQLFIFTSSLMLYTSGIISILGAVIVAMFHPYKVKAHNKIDTVLMLLMGAYFISYHANAVVKRQNDIFHITEFAQGVSISLIVVYYLLLVFWKLLCMVLRMWTGTGSVVAVLRRLFNKQHRHADGEFIESLQREFMDESDCQNYPPLLEGNPQECTY